MENKQGKIVSEKSLETIALPYLVPPKTLESRDIKTGVYEVEYHSQFKKRIPIMSWWYGGGVERDGKEWVNFTWQNAFVGRQNPDKTTIRFSVADSIGKVRAITIPLTFIKSMTLIDDDASVNWWRTKKYRPSVAIKTGFWSSMPEGLLVPGNDIIVKLIGSEIWIHY